MRGKRRIYGGKLLAFSGGLVYNNTALGGCNEAAGGKYMKATGIVRKIDELGRVVLPIELRRTMNLNERDPVEIFLEGESIVLRKYEAACLFCGGMHNLVSFKGKQICGDCLHQLRKE